LERAAIFAQHKEFVAGFMWFLSNDLRVPVTIRRDLSTFGLCSDEFGATGNWPPQLYVREARRTVGTRVFTQLDRSRGIGWSPDDVIGLGSFWFDSVVVDRSLYQHPLAQHTRNNGDAGTITADVDVAAPNLAATVALGSGGGGGGSGGGGVQLLNEGNYNAYFPHSAFDLPYWLLLPPAGDAGPSILSPCAPSASHVGFSSLRLEPTFMILGQAAGVAAALAARGGVRPGKVDTKHLQRILTEQRQRLFASDLEPDDWVPCGVWHPG
jgi:hypothetical protein